MNPIIKALESLTNEEGMKEFNMKLDMLALIPAKNRTFARYLGSLTTPTCDEKVVWTVFLEPAHLSKSQVC